MKFNIFLGGCKQSKKPTATFTLKDIVNYDCDKAVEQFRSSGDKSIKSTIPAFCPMGTIKNNGSRVIADMQPNNLVMLDVDHVDINEYPQSMIIEACKNCGCVMSYITCSGKGIRFIVMQYEGMSKLETMVAFLVQGGLFAWIPYLDTVTTDVSRLSIFTKRSDYLYWNDLDAEQEVLAFVPKQETIDYVKSLGDIKEYVKSTLQKAKQVKQGLTDTESDESKSESKTQKPQNNETKTNKLQVQSTDNVPYKNYTQTQIEENDRLYADYLYKGRKVSSIAEAYISYKTKGMGPESGERHSLYNLLCKNFRNLCDNDPRILHSVLPSLGHSVDESWKQCTYFCAVNKSERLPKDFWYWCNSRGFLELKTDDADDNVTPEDAKYDEFLKTMPPLPPILREFVKVAPYWFKIPVIASLQCYTALLCTNYRAYFYDGSPISTTLYSLIYAPAASGKSYVRRLKSILKSTDERDTLAMNKAKWYDRQQRENNGSGKLPSEIVWKQRLFASKTSLGEILKRQEAIGNHHWLQDVGEFSIWAATVKKNKEEWSAFFRTSYDNEQFMQSYQSANAYRGKVDVYPIVHGTCTLGQIKSFFTNVEDGLLTRFSFIPLLHQRYAKYQPWKLLSDKDQANIERIVERLDIETYKSPTDTESDEGWDYEFKEPEFYDVSYLYEPLLKWLEEERSKAAKDDNTALDTFRKRCARNAFVYALECRALWGKDDKKTRQKIIDNMLWDANVKLYYMRYLWENEVNDEYLSASRKKGMRNANIFDDVPENFSKLTLEQILVAKGYKTRISVLLSNWKVNGFIKETSKNNYKKISK